MDGDDDDETVGVPVVEVAVSHPCYRHQRNEATWLERGDGEREVIAIASVIESRIEWIHPMNFGRGFVRDHRGEVRRRNWNVDASSVASYEAYHYRCCICLVAWVHCEDG